MALWGTNDNVSSVGQVWLDYTTGIVTATGSNFGEVGFAKTGDAIRFGDREGGTYYGDAVIVGIASTTQLTIGSTSGLSGVAIAGEEYYISELPLYAVGDVAYSESLLGTEDKLVYGISTTTVGSAYTTTGIGTQYHVAHAGWVGVQTYVDMHGNLRVKTEVLVAGSGIQTGANGIAYPTNV